MANISIVRGTFVFDFNNCPQQEPSLNIMIGLKRLAKY